MLSAHIRSIQLGCSNVNDAAVCSSKVIAMGWLRRGKTSLCVFVLSAQVWLLVTS